MCPISKEKARIKRASLSFNDFIKVLFPLSIAFSVLELRVYPHIAVSFYAVLVSGIVFFIALTLLIRRHSYFDAGSKTFVWLLIFCFVACLSVVFSEYKAQSVKYLLDIGKMTLTATLLAVYLINFWDRSDCIRVVAHVSFWTGTIVSFSIWADFFCKVNFRSFFLYKQMASDRAIGIFPDPNLAAAKLLIFLPFMVYLHLQARKQHKRMQAIVYLIGTSVATMAILLTGSRAGMIVLVATFFLVVMKEWKQPLLRRRASSASLITGVMLIIAFFLLSSGVPDLLIPRAMSLYQFSQTGSSPLGNSLKQRYTLIQVGMQMFTDKPILGYGIGAYRYVLPNYVEESWDKYAHNTFLDILVGMGLLGFIPFFGLVAYIGLNIHHFWRLTGDDKYLYFGLSFLNLVMMLFFLTIYRSRYLWGLFIPVSIYLDNIMRRAKSRR